MPYRSFVKLLLLGLLCFSGILIAQDDPMIQELAEELREEMPEIRLAKLESEWKIGVKEGYLHVFKEILLAKLDAIQNNPPQDIYSAYRTAWDSSHVESYVMIKDKPNYKRYGLVFDGTVALYEDVLRDLWMDIIEPRLVQWNRNYPVSYSSRSRYLSQIRDQTDRSIDENCESIAAPIIARENQDMLLPIQFVPIYLLRNDSLISVEQSEQLKIRLQHSFGSMRGVQIVESGAPDALLISSNTEQFNPIYDQQTQTRAGQKNKTSVLVYGFFNDLGDDIELFLRVGNNSTHAVYHNFQPKRLASDPSLLTETIQRPIIAQEEDLDQETALSWFMKGLSATGLDVKIECYANAIRLNPQYADAYNNRGIAYYAKGAYDRAIQDYDEAIRLNPQYADAYHNRGIAYEKKGDHRRARQDFLRAKELGSPNAQTGLDWLDRLEE
ncbi:MAG: tetratricopeptide repeat protein [Candidatus Electryoneaceae bacterium]|nr:tetratricopeptide repeat protein [Candidatus Electryoneaceae bacterium]